MLGTSDEVLQCECCGKSDLKKTIALQLTEDGDAVYYGSDCASRALRHQGIEAKGPKLAKLSERIQFAVEDLARYEKSVAQYQGMIAAGHVRYVIGGREIGAELAMLLDHAKQDVRRGSEKLANLQDMTDLKVAA